MPPLLPVLAILFACSGSTPAPSDVDVSSATSSTPSTPSTPSPEARKVVVALNWFPEPEFGGLYEALVDGTYAKHGLDVEIQAGGAGAPVIPQVATGRVQFGVSEADEVVLARAQGADVVTIFGTYQTHPFCVMVHEKRGLKDLSELKGGTLALEDGIPFAQWLYKKFPFEGVTRVPYGGGVTQWMLDENYAQQAYVTSEPLVAKKQGGDPKCFLVADTGYNPYADVLVTSGATISSDPKLVQDFVDATAEGWAAYLKDGAAANAKIAELNPTLDKDLLGQMAEAQKPLITDGAPDGKVGAMDPKRWEDLEGQLADIGALKGDKPPVDSLYTNRFVTK